MKGWTMLLVGAFVLAGATVSANPHQYLGLWFGDFIDYCHKANDVIGIGGVCFGPGHVQPNSVGQAALAVNDVFLNPTSAFYCQDLNGDAICGHGDVFADEEAAGRADPAELKFRGIGTIHFEPAITFCAAVVIETPLDPTPRTKPQWAAGNNWDTAQSIFVFVDGPVYGGIWSNGGAGNSCGSIYSGGIIGDVNHT